MRNSEIARYSARLFGRSIIVKQIISNINAWKGEIALIKSIIQLIGFHDFSGILPPIFNLQYYIIIIAGYSTKKSSPLNNGKFRDGLFEINKRPFIYPTFLAPFLMLLYLYVFAAYNQIIFYLIIQLL